MIKDDPILDYPYSTPCCICNLPPTGVKPLHHDHDKTTRSITKSIQFNMIRFIFSSSTTDLVSISIFDKISKSTRHERNCKC